MHLCICCYAFLSLSGWQARQLGLKGALVISVADGSAAARANVRPTSRGFDGNVVLGDVIVGIDSQKVETVEDLLAAVDQYEVGQSVEVSFLQAACTRAGRAPARLWCSHHNRCREDILDDGRLMLCDVT